MTILSLFIGFAFLLFGAKGGMTPPEAPVAYITEIHYQNEETDQDERIEVAVCSGNPACLKVVLYNGNGGMKYDPEKIVGVNGANVPGSNYFTIRYEENGIQNGDPDGVMLQFDPALPDCGGEQGDLVEVLEFLSYEGEFTSNDPNIVPPKMSTDIGVKEGSSTPIDWSLQRMDCGTWMAGENTFGYINDILNICELCPDSSIKPFPGACGCDEPDTDNDNNGIPDCIDDLIESRGTRVIACEGETLHFSCAEGEIIEIVYANYGRTDDGVCLDGPIMTTECLSSEAEIAEMCEGQNECSFTASNDVFGEPCKGTFKYAEVIYECIPSVCPAGLPIAFSENPDACALTNFGDECDDWECERHLEAFGEAVCREKGWSTNNAFCGCGKSPNIPYARYTDDCIGTPAGEVCTSWECPGKSEPTGVAFCTNTGKWNVDTASCGCNKSPIISYAHDTSNCVGTPAGEVCTSWKCPYGSQPTGVAFCTNGGEWNVDTASCAQVQNTYAYTYPQYDYSYYQPTQVSYQQYHTGYSQPSQYAHSYGYTNGHAR